ncbi:SH3 domain-containing protein [Zooshikella sp. RANM57]|uniref:SH3 domain-containing protein n=1 Tax=Zooshikella sp. RANM57 TaxID=3425863 RepID=UPI003D6DDD4C
MKVQVIKTHISNYPNPIKFKCGESLLLGEIDTEYPNWIKVTTTEGNTGWAPLQYISVSSQPGSGVSTADYDANELNTHLGEKLDVIYELNKWFRVKNSQNVVGWVPAHTVEAV